MPPPPANTGSYLEMINRDMAARHAEQDEVRRLRREIEVKKLQMELADLSAPTKPTQPQRRPLDFYEQQITAWFNRLPPAARSAPRSMEDFINLLQGRTPGMRAHAPDVSRVLSGMGWVRRRSWRSDSSSARLWWPPQS